MKTSEAAVTQWPISDPGVKVRSAYGWIDVGPVSIPWYGGDAEKKAALEIARLISSAPRLLKAVETIGKLCYQGITEDGVDYVTVVERIETLATSALTCNSESPEPSTYCTFGLGHEGQCSWEGGAK